MKISYLVLTIFFLISAFIVTLVFADEFDDFAGDLNNAWNNTNSVQMLNLINTRLNSNTNDVLALSTKTYYYIFAECNLTNARVSVDHLFSVVSEQDNSEAESFCLEIKNEVYSIPLSESGPFSQSQTEQIHEAMTNFPAIVKCLWLSRKIDELE